MELLTHYTLFHLVQEPEHPSHLKHADNSKIVSKPFNLLIVAKLQLTFFFLPHILFLSEAIFCNFVFLIRRLEQGNNENNNQGKHLKHKRKSNHKLLIQPVSVMIMLRHDITYSLEGYYKDLSSSEGKEEQEFSC